jgi:TetR/AcrR family transcriptional regulator, transcriptional repressor for nem operon
MKVTRQKARNNRDLVVDTAARLLRERGLQATSVAEIMRAAGLTHGGFYRNFTSKEDLARQASAHAAARMAAGVAAHLAESSDPLRSLIEIYVSRTHRDNPGDGCVLPSLAADPACRSDPDLRVQFGAVIQGYLAHLAKVAPAMPATTASRDPAAILSEMVGAIVLSRAVSDGEIADRLVAAVTADIVGEVRADDDQNTIGAA